MIDEIEDTRELAIEAYERKTGRAFVPGEVVEIPVDALVFAEYQTTWASLEEFAEDRCRYDRETNEWLVYYVTEALLQPEVPPIYVDVLDEGVALVDGAHRTAAHFIAGRTTIPAQLNLV
jgi:hypothetical protein